MQSEQHVNTYHNAQKIEKIVTNQFPQMIGPKLYVSFPQILEQLMHT